MSRNFSKFIASGLFLSVACLTGCNTVSSRDFPTYPYQGIDLLAGVVGTASLSDGCYKMVSTSPPGDEFALIFPTGTKISDQIVVLPRANGGTRIDLAKTVSAQGGFNRLDEGEFIENPTPCRGRAFIVSRMSNDD